MENQILTDPMIKPENKVLETALGKNYKLYAELKRPQMEYMDQIQMTK